MAWTLRPALFYKKSGTVLALLWESCGPGTLLLPVRNLCWKISDAIKASTAASRCQHDSYNAAAEMDDEVERPAPADNCVASEYEAAERANDQVERDATPVPPTQNQTELSFRKNLSAVLALLWESRVLGTLLLPARKLSWKISDAIKVSLAASRCQRDSYIAAAGMDDEVERSAPADNCVTLENEAAERANDQVQRDATTVPAFQQQNEPAFRKNLGTVLSLLWGSCVLQTLFLPVQKFCWKIGNVIKASIAASRCQCDSYNAAAEVDDEVERSAPAESCVDIQDETAARANDLVPRDATSVPVTQQQNELAFWKNLGTLLALLWESCGPGTLLPPVRNLCWKISDAIKVSIAASRCQRDSYVAAAEMDDEVERSAPADNCVATEGEAKTRASDRVPRDATPVPAGQQQNELTLWRNRYRKMRSKSRREDRLGTLREIPEECLEDNQARNTRQRRSQSARPLGRGEDIRKQSGGPSKLVTIDVVGVSPSPVMTMLGSYTSHTAPSKCRHVGDYATRRDCKVTPTELLRDRETLRPQALHGQKKRGASLPPKFREPSKPQVEEASVARKATSIGSHSKQHPSSTEAKLIEIKEPSSRRSRAGEKPRPGTGKTSALSSAKTKARKLTFSVETLTSSSDTSKLNRKLARRSSRRVETKCDPLPNARSERKPGLRRPSDKPSQSCSTLMEEKRRRRSRGDCFLESSPSPARSLTARNSGRRTSNRDKKENARSRPAFREVQKSCEFTDDVSVNKPSAKREKPLSQWQPKRRDRSEDSGRRRISRSASSLQSRNSQNAKAKTTPDTGSPRTTSEIKTTEDAKPGRASEAVPRSRSDRRLRRNFSERHGGPATKRLRGISLENPSVLPDVIEEPRSLKRQHSARTPLAAAKDIERQEGESPLRGSPLDGVSRKSRSRASPAAHRAAKRRSKQGGNISPCPSNAFESTPLASSVPSCATSQCSTGLNAQADKAIVEKQRHRRWHSKYSKHVQESWEQWCKKRENTFSNGSMGSTAVNSSANMRNASLATTRKATGTMLASAASTATCASGTGELAHAFGEKLPAGPAARTRPPASTRRTLTLPCLENSFSNYSRALSSWNWPVVLPCSCSEALSSSCFMALSCSCSTDLSRSCFGLHGASQRARNSALVESDEVAVILDLSGRHGASFWPFCRRPN